MASLRTIARNNLEEAREGIAWIALYKEGRGWQAACFWPDIDREDRLVFEDASNLAELKKILTIDPHAIFVNGWYSNLGPIDEMTIDILANALRWQYESQHNQLADTNLDWGEPAPAPRIKRYGELRDGDRIRFYGYAGTVRDVKIGDRLKDGPYAGDRDVSFRVYFDPSEDHIERTVYNGGCYGGVESLKVAMLA